jgi:opacity protein-like surface antigen
MIQPSLDYFVIPNLSIGGAVGVAHGTGAVGVPDVSGTGILVEARVGYNIPLNDMFSIWPHLGIGYEHVSVDFNGGSGSGYRVPLIVTVPVLWHPADHFFLGVGPTLTTELANSITVNGQSMDQQKTTDVGLTAVLGGYFGI